ncbi:MAG: PKD domain-containing protein [Candidatus Eisenbacteria bacterium]|uniref:PKD domain-containing protein n=1 Tax=Eiseniibacteriota bacterium TaxID=2212470 RepID=A0A948RS65_UNCEI|nr:PKD domain-containing protein [Candidatus Eisenbacteria bacterium]MBU1948059.1 PKD domain-containing protein [Candidatus Eisenbacteria bacterium]MBU2689880.1 PKD domain-containing protein [Candidatus Eisenbacteria bacterium]
MRRIILFAITLSCILSASICLAEDRMVTVDGYCFLEDEASDHSGTRVLFEAVSPSAVTDSAFTADTGYISLGLSEGLYVIHYTHDGYLPHDTSEPVYIAANTTLADVTLQPGTIIEVSGDVFGEWTPDHWFKVIGDIRVPPDSSLVIHPGTLISFMDNYQMTVNGALIAAGTETDSIRFVSGQLGPAPGDWKGIVFTDSTTCSGSLEYCVIENAGSGGGAGDGWALKLESTGSTPILIENCTIRYSENNGIFCGRATAQIIGNHIYECEVGIYCFYSSSVISNNTLGRVHTAIELSDSPSLITGNTIENVVYGISCHGSSAVITGNYIGSFIQMGIYCTGALSAPLIMNNIIESLMYSSATGIICSASSPRIVGNIVRSNSTGILIESATPLIADNVISENNHGINAYSCSPDSIMYNNVWNNGTNYTGDGLPSNIGDICCTNYNNDPCDTYYNISMDPLFDPENEYHLLEGSPCIDAGLPDPATYDADGTIADIGAFPFLQSNPDPPVIDFTGDPTTGASPLAVAFTTSNTGGPIISWLWDFGDGTSSSRANPAHNYIVTEPTQFTVSLLVMGPGGGTDSAVKIDYIAVLPGNAPPVAHFNADPLIGHGDVQFNNQSLGAISTLLWTFGDEESSDEWSPLHHYAMPDTYTVCLEVGGAGGTDEECKIDYIIIVDPETVVAGFTPSDTFGVVPAPIAFTNTSSGTIDTYHWDFGDGDSSSVANPVHTYTAVGDFTVTLIAAGPANSDTASVGIRMLPAEAIITAVDDVPDDQGGQVLVSFNRSGHDTNSPRSEIYAVEAFYNSQWVTLLSGGAYGQEGYIYLVPTFCDSTAADPCLTQFRVIAHMDEGIFISDPMTGYSVDNIAPSVPEGFQITFSPGASILSWNPCPDDDFQYFNIYRGPDADFEPSPENLAHQTIATHWADESPGHTLFYKLTAVDNAGNESGPALASDASGAAGELSINRFALHPCRPNPLNSRTMIIYDVPRSNIVVTLRIYDEQGRIVRHLVDGPIAAGRHTVIWDGRDNQNRKVASGIYFYKLESDGFSQARKLSLLR